MEPSKGFEKFGIVAYTVDTKIPEFVEYLEKGTVMKTRCKRCQSQFFPPQADCSVCLARDMEWVEMKEEGELLTYSMVKYGPAGFEDKAPYIIGVARFGGVQVLAMLNKAIPEADVKVGMKVRVAVAKSPPDRVYYELQKA